MPTAPTFQFQSHHRSLDAMLEWLEDRGIDDRCVLAAMTVVPREPFIAMQAHVYDVALRLQALELVGDERVLQVGVGSGFATAVLSLLSAHVYAIEPEPELSSSARARIAAHGFDGISIACHDVDDGWPEHAPYDAILVMGSIGEVPHAIIDQLVIGGRIVMSRDGWLVRGTKRSATVLELEQLEPLPREEGN